jgi:TatD DNase family protein
MSTPAELFDTHAHLDDEQFHEDLDSLIQRAQRAGVANVMAVGTTAASSRAAVAIAHRFEPVHAAVGIQPNYGRDAQEEDWNRIVELANDAKVRAIGETGLDAYWDFTPFAAQQSLFARHLQLAQSKDLPFVVHMRDCEHATVEMLREARGRGPLRGVMHSFTGDAATAEACLELGLHISFAGMVTFTKSHELREVARSIPEDRILIETDAPYLSPHPHRAQRPNEPAMLVHTARCLAEVRGVSLETLAAQTSQNARQLFRIS